MKRGLILLACMLAAAAELAAADTGRSTWSSCTSILLTSSAFPREARMRRDGGDRRNFQLWNRFRDEDILVRIVNRADARIVAVYSDYRSDRNGLYTYTLGAKVTSTKDVPPGMVVRKVEAGNYAMFTSNGQAVSQLVVGLWKNIWSLEDAREIHRA